MSWARATPCRTCWIARSSTGFAGSPSRRTDGWAANCRALSRRATLTSWPESTVARSRWERWWLPLRSWPRQGRASLSKTPTRSSSLPRKESFRLSTKTVSRFRSWLVPVKYWVFFRRAGGAHRTNGFEKVPRVSRRIQGPKQSATCRSSHFHQRRGQGAAKDSPWCRRRCRRPGL